MICKREEIIKGWQYNSFWCYRKYENEKLVFDFTYYKPSKYRWWEIPIHIYVPYIKLNFRSPSFKRITGWGLL